MSFTPTVTRRPLNALASSSSLRCVVPPLRLFFFFVSNDAFITDELYKTSSVEQVKAPKQGPGGPGLEPQCHARWEDGKTPRRLVG